MIVKETSLKDCYIIKPPVFGDDRGYFSIRHDKNAFAKAFPQHPPFVLHNESFSSYGVLRGLHLQKGNAALALLVQHFLFVDV
ncbi:dTDP-4-dehydrorhamnose 3,5-epimerase family protein, partial [Nonlabens mediterrranea]|nr:dTDP-4-dehydrorhamnose 3,5-epimerase family protein [Nonlabens mediterrranea]